MGREAPPASPPVEYVGGIFTSIGGQPRNRIAAIDATTGLATAWKANADNWVQALAVSGGIASSAPLRMAFTGS